MRSVAEEVGVTATALYRHFENKDALVEAVVAQGFETFGSYVYRALEGRTPQERLRRSGEGYLRFALEQPEMYRTIFMTLRSSAPKATGGAHAVATFRFLVDRVRECVEDRTLKPGDPEAIAISIWAHIHGLVSLQIAGALGQSEAQFQKSAAASMRRLFEGLKS